MGKRLAMLIVLVVAVFAFVGVLYANQNITITIDGQKIESDVMPQLVQNRTLVPIRVITEYFGAEVNWRQESGTVQIVSPAQGFLDNYGDQNMYIMQAPDVLQKYKAGTVYLLDVRSPAQRGVSYITGSVHIPTVELLEQLDQIPKDKIVAVYCAKNINAAYAVSILNMQGYDAYILENGIAAWREAGGDITICNT